MFFRGESRCARARAELPRSAISTAVHTFYKMEAGYRGKWHSVFQMTRRYTWQRHTARSGPRLHSSPFKSPPIRYIRPATTQSFNPTIRPFLYSLAVPTCGMSKLPFCRSARTEQYLELTRSFSERVFLGRKRERAGGGERGREGKSDTP